MFVRSRSCARSLLVFFFFEFCEDCFSRQRLTCMIAYYRSSHLFKVCARVSTNQELNRSLFQVKRSLFHLKQRVDVRIVGMVP